MFFQQSGSYDEPSVQVDATKGAEVSGRRIGFVGAGRIGRPMVERLLDAGVSVRLFARDPETRQHLQTRGAEVVASVGEVAAGTECVITCLFSDAQLEEVTIGRHGLVGQLEHGATLISHTTGSPAVIARIAAASRARGADTVDAAFSGTSEDVQNGTLTILLGGAPSTLDKCEPLLHCYASVVLRTGAVGSAMTLKMINNLLFAANAQLAVEVTRLAADVGIDLSILAAAVGASSGSTRALDYLVAAGGPEEFGSTVQTFLRKDFAVCEEVADALALQVGLLADVVRRGAIEIGRT